MEMWLVDEEFYQEQIMEEEKAVDFKELKEAPYYRSEKLVKMLRDDDLWTFGETVPDSYTPKKMMNTTEQYVARLQDNADAEWKVLRKNQEKIMEAREAQATGDPQQMKLNRNPWPKDPFKRA